VKRLASGQRGFSLLEVLVAFAILSIALGVLLQIFATGMRNAGLSEEYSQAALYAESILAAYGREAPLAEGMRSGPINDRFSWRGTVSAYADGFPEPEKIGMRVYHISVEVFWDENQARKRAVTLETLRLVPFQVAGGLR